MPDDSPYTTGGIGLLGTKPSQEAMEDCDTLLMVGSSFPYIEFSQSPGRRAACRSISTRCASVCDIPVEVGLIGDSRRTLQELLPLLHAQGRPQLPEGRAGRHDKNGGS